MMQCCFDDYAVSIPGFSVAEYYQKQVTDITTIRGSLESHVFENGNEVKIVKKKDRGDWEINLLQLQEVAGGKTSTITTLRLTSMSDHFVTAFWFDSSINTFAVSKHLM